MKSFPIFIYGQIGKPIDIFSDVEYITAASVMEQLISAKNAKELVIHINSTGGSVIEGFAIHDMLANSGKKVTTIIEGLCASIATVIALSGSVRKITQNSKYFIHNPWGNVEGDAATMQKAAQELQETENELAGFYQKTTGANLSVIQAMMKKETTMTPAEALRLGFVTEVVTPMKAVAIFNPNNKTMATKTKKSFKEIMIEFLAELQTKKVGAAADAGTGGDPIEVTSTDGQDLSITDGDGDGVPAVGDQVTIDGNPAEDADYNLPDGTIITTASGAITAVTPPPANQTQEELVAENTKLKTDLATAQANAKELEKQFNLIAKNVRSNYVPKDANNNVDRNNNTGKTVVDPVKKALELRRAELKKEKEGAKK